MTSHAASAFRPGELSTPARLLAGYGAGDFLFATRQRTLLATGVQQELRGDTVAALSSALADDFTGTSSTVAVGVVPFDTTADSPHRPRLVVPERLHSAGPAHQALSTMPSRAVGIPSTLRAVPGPDRHIDTVRRALDVLRAGELSKVVLARVLDVVFAGDVDPAGVLHNLVADNPDGFTFAAPLPDEDGTPRTLVGSSPELLVRRAGPIVTAHPHAGTAPRSDDPMVDDRNARALLASAKDKAEHEFVVDAVVEALRPYCAKLTVPSEPSLAATPTVWHLGTEITGELREDVPAFQLAAALHPTPAVCGTPTGAARELVGSLEPFDRGYYAGAVGWVDAAGDGEWAVAVRCGEVRRNRMRLYAGGGIVPESDPEDELDETTAKFTTLLRAMGIDPEGATTVR